ncbi:MAG: sigma-70 family RNA polymerase sigma factor, partial [Micrococcales bacterium]|nr:sigma-70 family RNA polymerase sigma factor [Micrococcales bacterium]
MTAVSTAIAHGAESDASLIAQARDGDQLAFSQLYERHFAAARLVAAQYAVRPADVDDLVAESFAQIFRMLQNGKGPNEFFRAYLFTCVRNLAARSRENQAKVHATDDVAVLDSVVDHPDQNLEFIERELIQDAYASLPERWRTVLWYLEVEGLKPAEVAPALGLSPNGVAALAYRAREGLRQAYLQCHVSEQMPQECIETGQRLGAYTRGALAERDREKVEEHLETCDECRMVVDELGEVNQSLRGVIGPLVLGSMALPLLKALKQAPPLGPGAVSTASAAGSAGSAGQTGAATTTSPAASVTSSGTKTAGRAKGAAGRRLLRYSP